MSSKNFVYQWQSLRPILFSMYLRRFKLIIILSIFYCVRIYCLALDFSTLLFPVVDFLINKRYATHDILHLTLENNHVSRTFSFFELIFFQCQISFIPEALKCLVFSLFRINIFVSQNCTIFTPWFLQWFAPFQ